MDMDKDNQEGRGAHGMDSALEDAEVVVDVDTDRCRAAKSSRPWLMTSSPNFAPSRSIPVQKDPLLDLNTSGRSLADATAARISCSMCTFSDSTSKSTVRPLLVLRTSIASLLFSDDSVASSGERTVGCVAGCDSAGASCT